MAGVLIGLALAPWLSPLSFGSHPPGWRTGSSGTFYETVGHAHARVPISTAWAANVRYRDNARADPPNTTLEHLSLSRTGIIIWASIQLPSNWPPSRRRVTVPYYSLTKAYHFPCCEAWGIRGGEWELYSFGPQRAYSLLVRVYWASPPTETMIGEAERVLRALRLPRPRS